MHLLLSARFGAFGQIKGAHFIAVTSPRGRAGGRGAESRCRSFRSFDGGSEGAPPLSLPLLSMCNTDNGSASLEIGLAQLRKEEEDIVCKNLSYSFMFVNSSKPLADISTGKCFDFESTSFVSSKCKDSNVDRRTIGRGDGRKAPPQRRRQHTFFLSSPLAVRNDGAAASAA